MRSIGIYLFSLVLSTVAIGQDSLQSKWILNGAGEAMGALKKFDRKVFIKGSESEMSDALRTLAYSSGYLEYRYSISDDGPDQTVDIIPGAQYQWTEIAMNEEVRNYMRKAGVRLHRLERQEVSPVRIGKAFNKTLDYLENSGFPFASIKLDSLIIQDAEVKGSVVLQKGPAILIDSLNVIGDLQVRPAYISNATGIKPGAPYNESAIVGSQERLSRIGFLNENRPVEVRFLDDETRVTLFLQKKQASRFDGIVGFLPDDQTGELLITGDVSVHLENALRQGEVLDVAWRRLQSNTQDLVISLIIPYVLNSPISPDFNFKIYRRDTTFSDVFGQVGLRYLFDQSKFIRVFVDRQISSLISTASYENTSVIPEFLDRTITSYGIGARYSRLDYLLNPSKGFDIDIDAAIGNKVIQENPALPQFIYDSLNLQSLQLRSNVDASYYVSIVKRLVWHQRFFGGSVLNDQLFNNEAFRIGGYRSIRGFNEESIFATSYAIARCELRYQLDQNGFLFALFDQGWYENTSLNRNGARRDTPYALGLGVSIGTKAGVFSLATALGSQQNNPLLIRAAKFHFGFISVF